MSNFHLALGAVTLLAVSGPAAARHVVHPVTPQNLDRQVFSFAVQVSDAGEGKEIRVTVRPQAGGPHPVGSAYGRVELRGHGAAPAVTRAEVDGGQVYTFRLSAADIGSASFVFTETPEDLRTPFPSPGDYWRLDLRDFVTTAQK